MIKFTKADWEEIKNNKLLWSLRAICWAGAILGIVGMIIGRLDLTMLTCIITLPTYNMIEKRKKGESII